METITDLFLDKELSALAKAKGFDEPCFGYHTDYELQLFSDTNKNSTFGYFPTAPLYSQIIDWFLTKRLWIDCRMTDTWDEWIADVIGEDIMTPLFFAFSGNIHSSKREALNEAIKEAFKLI